MITPRTAGQHRPERVAARLTGGRHSAPDGHRGVDPRVALLLAHSARVARDAAAARRARRAVETPALVNR
jgi:hypothetical protein